MSAREVMWLFILIVVGVAVRVFMLDLPMIHDEGGYALAARGWLEGTGRLYDDLWISRPQGIFIIYGITMRTFGYGVVAFRAMAWIFATLTVLTVWLFARRWSGPRTAVISALVATLLLAAPTLEGFTANAEIFAGLPAALAMFWLLRQEQDHWTRVGLIGVGVFIGLSTVLKPSGITLWPAAIIFLIATSSRLRKDYLRRAAWLTTGLAIVGAATLLHGWYLGFDNFLYATVLYRFRLQSPLTVGLLHNLRGLGWMFINASEFFLLIVLGIAFGKLFHVELSSPVRSRNPVSWILGRFQGQPADILLRLWITAATVGVMMGGDYWTHYLILLIPPLSLWLGRILDKVIFNQNGWERYLGVTMFVLLLFVPYGMALDGTNGIYERIYRHPGYRAQTEVAHYIRDHTTPGETIYVAFDQAAIYYESDRAPAYRHLYQQELRALPNSYGEIIAILNSNNRPVYIVATRQPASFPDDSRAFWREVSRYYDIEIMIDGVPIYRVKPGLHHSGEK